LSLCNPRRVFVSDRARCISTFQHCCGLGGPTRPFPRLPGTSMLLSRSGFFPDHARKIPSTSTHERPLVVNISMSLYKWSSELCRCQCSQVEGKRPRQRRSQSGLAPLGIRDETSISLHKQLFIPTSLTTHLIRSTTTSTGSAQPSRDCKTGQHGLNRCRCCKWYVAFPHHSSTPGVTFHPSFGDDKHNQTFQTRVFDLFGELKPSLHVSLILKTTSRIQCAVLHSSL
jgi:hypothetical protein